MLDRGRAYDAGISGCPDDWHHPEDHPESVPSDHPEDSERWFRVPQTLATRQRAGELRAEAEAQGCDVLDFSETDFIAASAADELVGNGHWTATTGESEAVREVVERVLRRRNALPPSDPGLDRYEVEAIDAGVVEWRLQADGEWVKAEDAASRVREAEERLEAIQKGEPYPDCWADCGRMWDGKPEGYCCDGAWDQRRRARAAEAERDRLRKGLERIAADLEQRAADQRNSPPTDAVLARGDAYEYAVDSLRSLLDTPEGET